MDIPVYLIAGFLDSGKTTFINGILEDGFARGSRTLLVRCEEGEMDYTPPFLNNVAVVTLEGEDELSSANLQRYEKKFKPQQILIEFNGMWSLQHFCQDVLPSNWILYQLVTLVESATFDSYAKNLGQIMMEKLINADMIVFNRCDPILAAALRQRNLRMVNRRASIYLEHRDGTSEDYVDDTVCPFDLDSYIIHIPDADFGIWYVDAMEHPDRYNGKLIRAKLVVCHLPQYPGEVILGRFAMTCCEEDISFFGVVAHGDGFDSYPNRSWTDVTARVSIQNHPAYEGKGPVLQVTALEPATKPEQEVLTF